jgi:hypothetical protein
MYGLSRKLPVVAAVLLGLCSMAFAAPPEAPKPEQAPPPPAAQSREQAMKERVDRAMEMIRASDPNKATALEALRTSDPNQFGRELREYFRSRRPADLGPGFFDLGDMGHGGPEVQGGPGRPEGRDGRRPFGPGLGSGDMEKEKEEFGKWLKANYPEMEKKFSETKKLDPKDVDRRTMAEFRPYIGLYFASKTNPKLAEILKQDIPLRNQRRELVDAINKTTDAAEKAKLTEQLLKVVEKRFDLLVQQKQLEYDMLMEWMKDLEKRLGQSKNSIDEMKQNAKGHIDKQMQDLLAPRRERPRSQN